LSKSEKAKSAAVTDDRTNRILREGALILWAVLAIFLLVALLTYDTQDPGWSRTSGSADLQNAGGALGAWLADILLVIFGYLAYLLPFLVAHRVWKVFRSHTTSKKSFDWPLASLRTLGFVLIMTCGCGITYLNHLGGSSLPQGVSGIVGEQVGEASYNILGLYGSNLVLLAALLFGITLFTGLSWLKLFDNTGRAAIYLWNRACFQVQIIKGRLAEKRERKAAQDKREKSLETHKEKTAKRVAPKIQAPPAKPKTSERAQKEKQSSLFQEAGANSLPTIGLLDPAREEDKRGFSEESLEAMSRLLELKLLDFGVEAEVVAVLPGPVVTRFEIQPAAGTKASKITNLARDLARSLAVVSVRVVEVIPGKSVIGIEVPNENREIVRLSQVISSSEYEDSKSKLTLALGHDISGSTVTADLARMPHLLVAGTTGSGKSVAVNVMLLSLLYKSTPEDVRLILVDPKMLELAVYEGIPHLLTPVITDMKDAANGLRWCVGEMERRYKLMAQLGVRNLAGYNRKVEDAIAEGTPIKDPLWKPDEVVGLDQTLAGEGYEDAPDLTKLPCIVVVIDEFADMMMIVDKKKVEQLISRIAQKARAAGIHLILATQRPSVDVITGLIKANVPTRIAFQVSSRIDSRTILDQGGAEQLLGHGDMLYLPPGQNTTVRVHGAFVDDHEVHQVVEAWRQLGEPDFVEGITDEETTRSIPVPGWTDPSGEGNAEDSDALYDEAVEFVCQSRKASISSVQRKLRVGYNRAARLIEAMEAAGVVTEMQPNGNREVIAPAPRD
jgi:DNA segregation ATPase FtsK/SpoIIIE, S-DNA-T family